MASFGIEPPGDSSSATADARGGTSGSQVVLVSSLGHGNGAATVKTDQADYAPGQVVTITGSGWQFGEVVSLVLHEDPAMDPHPTLTATADASGHIFNNEFVPDVHDVGVRFYMTAMGQTSGSVALATFMDAGAASDGDGTMTVSPTGVTAGTIGNTLIFTFAAPNGKDFNAGSQATILVPDGWTAPPSGNVVVTTGPAPACTAATLGTIAGTGPWTVPINMTCVAKAQFRVTFSGVTAPTTTGANIFTTQTKQNLGTLTNITTQPTVTVNAAGSGRVGVVSVGAQTGTLTYGTAGGVTFLVTVNRGSGTGAFTANLTLPVPAGASFTFSPSSLSFGSTENVKTSTLTMNTASTTPAGSTTFTVQATNSSDATDYGQANGTLTVNKANQTITFSALAAATFGDADFTVSATATSGLAVIFGASANCTVAGSTVHITGAGSCTISASQGGNTNYNPAPDVAQTFAIARANQTITFSALADKTFGDADFTVSATTSSGLVVNFSASGNCTVSSSSVHITGAGSCTITASQGGNANYNPAPDVRRAFAITKADPTISFGALAGKTYGDPDFGVSATASSSLGVSFSASGNCTIAGSTVHITGAGSCTITASQSGHPNYNPAANVAQAFAIGKRALTISAHGVNKLYDGTTTATVTLSDNRVAGDVFTDSYTAASFASKTVGSGKLVSVSGISISGTDAGNYTFNTTASTTADITARPLTVSAAGVNKLYDGTTTATVTLSDDRVSGDVFTDSYTAASFASKTVGTGKPVSVSAISISGTDAGDYTFNTTASATADITARPLTVSATGVTKIYDGATTATVTLADDRVSGDVFTDSYTAASFANKTVGTGKLVSVSGISISGTDAGNNTFNTTAATTADITARPLTVSATGVTNLHSRPATPPVSLSDNRVAG